MQVGQSHEDSMEAYDSPDKNEAHTHTHTLEKSHARTLKKVCVSVRGCCTFVYGKSVILGLGFAV